VPRTITRIPADRPWGHAAATKAPRRQAVRSWPEWHRPECRPAQAPRTAPCAGYRAPRLPSIDVLRCAARRRNLRFSASSRLRMVMLATKPSLQSLIAKDALQAKCQERRTLLHSRVIAFDDFSMHRERGTPVPHAVKRARCPLSRNLFSRPACASAFALQAAADKSRDASFVAQSAKKDARLETRAPSTRSTTKSDSPVLHRTRAGRSVRKSAARATPP
jgi:hypothetical protein